MERNFAKEIVDRTARADVPYPPSWIDRLQDWIDDLPFPGWLFYPISILTVSLILHAELWIEGLLPLGMINGSVMQLPLWGFVSLAPIHYLDRFASTAMDKFRPALSIEKREFEQFKYQMTTMAWRTIWVITVIAATLALLAAIYQPAFFGPGSASLFATLFAAIFATFAFAFGLSLIYHTIRQLVWVQRIYQKPIEINVFHLEPLYSFSSLTARTSIVWILLLGVSYIVNVLLDPGDPSTELIPFFLVLNPTLALICFLLPLWGIHTRISEEKQNLEYENNHRIAAGLAELHRKMDQTEYEEMGGFRNGVSGLLAFREEINKISTWPWEPSTLRGVLSAIFLPILLWLLQQILARTFAL